MVRAFNGSVAPSATRRVITLNTVVDGSCKILENNGAGATLIENIQLGGGEKAACHKAFKPVCSFVRLTAP